MPSAKRRPRAPATRAGQGAGRGRCARRPCPPAGGPCSALGARAPLGPTRAWLAFRVRDPRAPGRPSVLRDHGLLTGRSVFISARASRSRSGALFAITQYHVWEMRPGRKTKPQAEAAAAGGDRAGGGERGGGKQSPARGGAGAHRAVPHGPSYSWGARKPGAGSEDVTPVRSGGEPRASVEPGEPQPWLVLLEELWGDHLEPLHPTQ